MSKKLEVPIELKELRKKKIHELIHLWANRKIKCDLKKGDWKFTEFDIWLNNRKVAIYDTKRKIYFVVEFENGSAYGGGNSCHSIFNAIHTKKFLVYKLPDFEIPDNYNYLKDYLLGKSEYILHSIAYLKQACISNWSKNISFLHKPDDASSYIDNRYDTNVINFLDLFPKRTVKKLLKTTIIHKYCLEKYNGWGSKNVDRYYLNLEFNFDQLINDPNSILTEEETKLIKFKEWRFKYLRTVERNHYDVLRYTNKFSHDLKQSKEIYDDETRKQLVETTYENNLERFEKDRLTKETKKDLDFILKHEENKEKFRTFFSSIMYRYNFKYPVLRIVRGTNLQDDVVNTSMGVNISMNEAKKAFKFFIANKDKQDSLNITGIKISHFEIKGIKTYPRVYAENGEAKFVDEKCLVIGCHKLFETEIMDFIKFYKLDWL